MIQWSLVSGFLVVPTVEQQIAHEHWFSVPSDQGNVAIGIRELMAPRVDSRSKHHDPRRRGPHARRCPRRASGLKTDRLVGTSTDSDIVD